MKYFVTIFLEETDRFISGLDPKIVKKVFYNVRIAEQTNDPKLFKKLNSYIWEFRTKCLGLQMTINMKSEKIKMYTLDKMEDKYIGKKGTKERDDYEYELRMEILSRMIKSARKERNLTQEQLGELVGVKKAQISKLENGANSATIDTILKVFKALKAEIHFNITLENQNIRLA